MRTLSIADIYAHTLVHEKGMGEKAEGGRRGVSYKVMAPFPFKVLMTFFNIGMLTPDEVEFINTKVGFIISEYNHQISVVYWFDEEMLIDVAWNLILSRYAKP